MVATPRFQGVFSTVPKDLGLKIGAAKREKKKQQAEAQFRKAAIELRRLQLELDQKTAQQAEARKQREEAAAANRAPFELAKMEQSLRQGEANILQTQINIKDKGDRLNLQKAKFLQEKLAGVKTQSQVDVVNEALVRLGVLDADKTIQSPVHAHAIRQGSREFESSLKAQRSEKTQKKKFESDLVKSVGLEKIRQKGRIASIQEKARQGVGTGVNINVAPGGLPGIPGRAHGGPVEENKPFVVGEQGPELFVPDQNGQIVNQQQLAQANTGFDVSAEAEKILQETFAEEPAGATSPSPSAGTLVTDDLEPAVRRQIISGQARKGRVPIDSNDLNKGFRPLPGTEIKTPESASKIQMLKTGLKAAEDVERFIFNEDGSINRKNLTASDVPVLGSIPFTEGRQLRTRMEFGIQAITRGETGAAMPPSEVENTRIRFMPRVGDPKPVIDLKIKLFREFMSGALKLIHPGDTPSFNVGKFNSEFEKNGRTDFIQRFLKVNPGATAQDADLFIEQNNKSFLPEQF